MISGNKDCSSEEIYHKRGYGSEHADPVLDWLTNSNKTGIAQTHLHVISAETGIEKSQVACVLYGLRDSGLIEYMQIEDDTGRVTYCVERPETMLNRIMNQSNKQWLADYDAAYRYGDEQTPKKSEQVEDDE